MAARRVGIAVDLPVRAGVGSTVFTVTSTVMARSIRRRLTGTGAATGASYRDMDDVNPHAMKLAL